LPATGRIGAQALTGVGPLVTKPQAVLVY